MKITIAAGDLHPDTEDENSLMSAMNWSIMKVCGS